MLTFICLCVSLSLLHRQLLGVFHFIGNEEDGLLPVHVVWQFTPSSFSCYFLQLLFFMRCQKMLVMYANALGVIPPVHERERRSCIGVSGYHRSACQRENGADNFKAT